MTNIEFRSWLKGLLMGLARGPVDDALIRMIEENLPNKAPSRGVLRQALAGEDQDFDVPPPPPADNPEAALEQDMQPGMLTPEQIRAMRLSKEPGKVGTPALPPRARKKPHSTKVGTDEDLQDAMSGGEVLRLG